MNRTRWIPLLLWAAIVGPATRMIVADEKPLDARLAAVAPFLDESIIAVVRVDVRRVDSAQAVELATRLGLPSARPFDAAEFGMDFERMVRSFREAGGEEAFFVASLADLADSPPFVVIPVRNGADPDRLLKVLEREGRQVREHKGDVVIGSSQAVSDRLKLLRPTRHRALEQAFAMSDDSPVQVVVTLPILVRQLLIQLAPNLPQEIGGGTTQSIVDNVDWASLGFNLAPRMDFRLTIRSKSEASARELDTILRQIFPRIAALPHVKQTLPGAEELFARLQPKVDGDRLVTRINGDESQAILQELAAGPIAEARRAETRTRSMNNLKQIGLAMHNYHDGHTKFPPAASRSKDGKSLLSWRVHLLPFLQQEALYKQFQLNEPWDSPANRPLAMALPAVYASPSAPELATAGKTLYVVPTGRKSIFESPEGTKISDILDGTSNTVLAIETIPSRAVIWTKPDDWEFDEKDPLKGIVDENGDGWLSLFADGSVRRLPKKIDKLNLRRILQMNDGEIVDPF